MRRVKIESDGTFFGSKASIIDEDGEHICDIPGVTEADINIDYADATVARLTIVAPAIDLIAKLEEVTIESK